MALPELDTSEISFIAYWNFSDHGGGEMDPTETESVMETFKEYSNGVDGSIHLGQSNKQNRLINCRVKDDGWIIAWIDATEDYTALSDNPDSLEGPYDVLNDWTNAGQNISPSQNNLERTVNRLYSALSNSGQATYNPGDVALYNYLWPNATTLTQISTQTYEGTASHDTTVVEGTNLHAYVVAASSEGGNMSWEGSDIATGSYRLGSYDAITDGGAAPGNTYTATVNPNSYSDGMLAELIAWS